MLSQKCQYAVRATFELAKRYGQGPVRVWEIAQAQAIPPRFLEVILVQLKQGGFVESRRGNEGGYLLRKEPQRLTVGEVIRFVEGPQSPVSCTAGSQNEPCSLAGGCVFLPMWERARKAAEDVYNGTTFQDLVEEETRMGMPCPPSYAI